MMTRIGTQRVVVAVCLLGGLSLSAGCAMPRSKEQRSLGKHAAHPAGLSKQEEARRIRYWESQRRDDQYQAALARWRLGDGSGCERILSDLLRHEPGHREANLLLAEVFLLEEQPRQIVDRMAWFCEQHPNDAQVLHTMGLVLGSMGHHDEALELFSRSVEEAPTNPDFQFTYDAAKAQRDWDLLDHSPATPLLAEHARPIEDTRAATIHRAAFVLEDDRDDDGDEGNDGNATKL